MFSIILGEQNWYHSVLYIYYYWVSQLAPKLESQCQPSKPISWSIVGLLGLALLSKDASIAFLVIGSCLIHLWSQTPSSVDDEFDDFTQRADVPYPEMLTGLVLSVVFGLSILLKYVMTSPHVELW